jgi:NADPH-dependent glutamate synthase beta subunit-like oxidoreductase
MLGAPLVIEPEGLQRIIDILAQRGYRVIGPRMRDGAILYDTIARLDELPVGWPDWQDGGKYRLEKRGDEALFGRHDASGHPCVPAAPRRPMNEIRRIEEMGVAITLNHKVEDVLAERDAGDFDAVFVAIGAHISRHADIPARDAARVLDAVTFLRGTDLGEAPRLGRRVVVYGGGNTAMDAARTARRLGADEALIIYHRDRAHMPARAFEADEAIEEGVKIKWLTSIKEIIGSSLTVERMTLDENGRPKATGEIETIEADAVVLALGQQTDSAFLRRVPGIEFKPDGTVIVDAHMMTGHPGIFAGGDMVPCERTVTVAVGHGKLAAHNIEGWLRAEPYVEPSKAPLVYV